MRQVKRDKGEPTLPLINIVFLMLIFFLVAAQLARPLDPSFQLAQIDDLNFIPAPDALVLKYDGDLWFRGNETSADMVIETLQKESANDDSLEVRLIPDRRSDAARLIEVSQDLREAGATAIFIVTQKALK